MSLEHFLLVTYDSCRYDTLRVARTPVLDSYGDVVVAQAPGNYTYASHQSFFVGLLPNATVDVPYLNRFNKQLLGLLAVGEQSLAKEALVTVTSTWNMVRGFQALGWQTVGAGAMNWFRQESLTAGFERFRFTGRDADAQVQYLIDELDPKRPFFGFVNFGETHAPYTYAGKQGACPVDVRARRMAWPPRPPAEEPVGCESAAFTHQVEAAEFLDSRLPRLFAALPGDTVVVVCADHGECFGEDGYWGHGINHPKVLDVPLAIFRLDRQPIA